MPPNTSKTLRNLRLKPGAALMKQALNAKRPREVTARDFFPGGNSTARPTINTRTHIVTPEQVSVNSLFPERTPSAFNLDPRTLRLRKRQEDAVKAAEGQEVLAFPMNESQGGDTTGGRRTRKHRGMRKHSKHRGTRKHRGGSCRKI
jgi:hypothetical protein